MRKLSVVTKKGSFEKDRLLRQRMKDAWDALRWAREVLLYPPDNSPVFPHEEQLADELNELIDKINSYFHVSLGA